MAARLGDEDGPGSGSGSASHLTSSPAPASAAGGAVSEGSVSDSASEGSGPVAPAPKGSAPKGSVPEGSASAGARTVTLDDVRSAQKTLSGISRLTALEGSRYLSGLVGSPVHFKCENLQRTGSFKLRGGYVRIAGLSPEERAAGVVAASAGNHAQGVALAASLLGVRSTVFMPEGAPLPKIAATRDYGAEVRLCGQIVDETMRAAQEYAERTGAVFIHPFDHPDIIAGQGTVGLEILEQCPEVRTVVVGIGGGGLAAGIAVAVKALRPDVRVVGVQAEGAAAYPPSLAAGRPVTIDAPVTMADGIKVGRPGEVPFRIIEELVDEVRTVTEDELSSALLLCLERAKLVVEPAGASPVAALLSDPKSFEGPVVAVLSGGNVDPLLMQRILRHGMAAAGRYLSLRLRLTDRPGALATLLGVLSTLDANVLDVSHVRTNPRLGLSEAEVELHLETKGTDHCEDVREALRGAGYTVMAEVMV
ncbi:threonine ammonia-lyase [Streptomyces sp. SID8382]|uniref:threonine ammonia-lyase n=1 Tax=Streptomyces malaysiensis TaxID=92644 RepID=UPI000C2C836B|nr:MULTISPECIES: threonine ammonia-lyase [unclassified Streptomyces]AUA11652.1 L-threonine dehydratase catabolic TdcB [Streptomyces sp. M56]MYX55319.1 threonine ammonia-lyase [Streptomyces sp. SID8382]WPB91229.1 threonine ammonia-lyase [Streptomyces malaysiensis]